MRVALMALALVGGSCSGRPKETVEKRIDASVVATPSASASAAPAGSAPAPVQGDWIEPLALATGTKAFVTPPVGARDRRPIVVAIHGAMDDPGLICGAWRIITDVHPFVVCPAGNPVGKNTYVWPSSDVLAKRVDAAIAAVEARYPDHVTPGAPVLYVAFSQGATLAGPVLAENGKRLSRAVLTEGAHRIFEDGTLARRYHASGGERVLLTCSQPGCAGTMAGSRSGLARADVTARVLDCGPHGHSMTPPVREAIHGALPWITEGLPGWEGYAAAPKLDAH